MKTTPTTLTIYGTSAINLTDLTAASASVQSVLLAAGQYEVSMVGTIYYTINNGYPLQQVYIFSTAPLTTGNSEAWFYTVSDTAPIIITSDGSNPTYAFIVDQLNVADNSGSVIVTFTPIL